MYGISKKSSILVQQGKLDFKAVKADGLDKIRRQELGSRKAGELARMLGDPYGLGNVELLIDALKAFIERLGDVGKGAFALRRGDSPVLLIYAAPCSHGKSS